MSETRAAIVWTISHATERGEQWRTMVAAKDPAEALRLVTQRHPWVVPGVWKIECEPLITSPQQGAPTHD